LNTVTITMMTINMSSKPCRHPCCPDDGPCRKPKKQKKVYQLKRTAIKRQRLPKGDINLLSHNELEKVAQSAFNAFVRNRDKDKPCICGCGGRVEQAMHFFPAGSYSGVRFDEVNVNGGSTVCNYFKPGAAIDPEVETGIIARYGMATVNELIEKAKETRAYKWSKGELIKIIEKYKA
jgi:hypothetical protein